MLKNVNWEKGLQRLWLVYAFIVICGALSERAPLAAYSGPTLSAEWITTLVGFVYEDWIRILFWMFIPVVISKAIQWVIKGFKPQNK